MSNPDENEHETTYRGLTIQEKYADEARKNGVLHDRIRGLKAALDHANETQHACNVLVKSLVEAEKRAVPK